MKISQLLVNEISLAVATTFLIVSAYCNYTLMIIVGIALIIYSSSRIKALKGKTI